MQSDSIPIFRWFTDEALPLWWKQGVDYNALMFEERLTLTGNKLSNVPRRLHPQGRQLFVFATAHLQGWFPISLDTLRNLADTIIRLYFEPDGKPGWVMSVSDKGEIIDRTRDFYAHAFILLAFASLYKVFNDERYLTLADRTLDFMDKELACRNGGYLSSLPIRPDKLRHQNPHMHLLESLLALFEVTQNPKYLDRAKNIVELFKSIFIHPEFGILIEYFDEDWQPAKGDKGCSFEPGHHYEWAFLLHWFDSLAKTDHKNLSLKLKQTADELGNAPDNLIYGVVKHDGTVLDATYRLWQHTEAIRTARIFDTEEVVAKRTDVLLNRFLKKGIRGGWVEHWGIDGKPTLNFLPASSLYHVVEAVEAAASTFSL